MKNVINETLRILVKSYTHIFILLCVFVGCSFLISMQFDVKSNFNGFDSSFLLYLVIYSLNYLLFHTITLSVCYQIDNALSKKRYNNYLFEIDWLKTAFDSIEKMPNVIAIFMLYTAKAVIVSIIAGIVALYVLDPMHMGSFGMGMMSLTIAVIVYVIYFTKLSASVAMATFLIVIKKCPLTTSIETAANLLANKGQQSCFYMALFVAIKVTLMILLLFAPFHLFEISELICLPLHACLTISLAKHLE